MGSEYIITSDGSFISDDQLIHALARGNKGWVKPNHKYINRKWKNGRYVYTYETDTGTRAVARTASQQVVKENAEQDKFVERLNSDKSALYPSSYDKYRAYQKSTDKNTIDKIKDALGFDERDMYKQTKRNYNNAVNDLENSKNKASEKRETYDRIRNFNSPSQRSIDESYTSWRNAERVVASDQHYADRYGAAYVNSKKEYFNTPLGKVTKASESVESWVSKTIDDMDGWIKKLAKR